MTSGILGDESSPSMTRQSRGGSSIYHFFRSNGGLATVEWVALSAGVVIMAIIIGVTLMAGLQEPAASISNKLSVSPPPPPP